MKGGNAHAIAAVDVVGVLFIGPLNLRLNLQSDPGRTSMDYAACLREVAAAAKDAAQTHPLEQTYAEHTLATRDTKPDKITAKILDLLERGK